jgi:hypothetical protein
MAVATVWPATVSCGGTSADAVSAKGPLRIHPRNPRYFTDGTGRAVFLTGSHTWANLQDTGIPPVRPFDWTGYLEMMRQHNHNFMRLWSWEQAAWAPWTSDKIVFEPHPYLRKGPGTALDGGLKFDLQAFNPEYFKRMRARITEAGKLGIYVSIMLFQGFSSKKPGCGNPWPGNPFNVQNNINGIDSDKNQDASIDLDLPKVREIQTAYIKKVIDSVNDLNNVLYEVVNEGGEKSWDWFVVDTVHQYETGKPKQHPVGLTGYGAESLSEMLASKAEWVSPGSGDGRNFMTDPPAWNGNKVCVLDTDHLWGHGGTVPWAWKSLVRGYNTLLMDAWEPIAGKPCPEVNWGPRIGYPRRNLNRRDDPTWEPVRKAIGHTRTWASRMDLAAMTPSTDIASTGYCLANPGREYLVYLPEGDQVALTLPPAYGSLQVEWMHPVDGTIVPGGTLRAGARKYFAVPFVGPAVLYVRNKLPRGLWQLER